MSSRSLSLSLTLATAALLAGCDPSTAPPDPTAGAGPLASRAADHGPTTTVYSTGFVYPRGLQFDDDGILYVAEAGTGGTSFTTPTDCVQAGPEVAPYHNGPTSRISRVDRHGTRTTFAQGFPSGLNNLGDALGIADIAFIGGRMYALSSGGGCSHGTLTAPAAVLRLREHGAWTQVANLSAYLLTHPVANPYGPDFEPDGSLYSMIAAGPWLVAVEPNHGDLVRIDPRTGSVSRIADISASQGHIVPTVVAERHGWLYVGNLGTFPSPIGAEKILRVSPSGAVSVAATGFTQILGLDFDRAGRMYVLESSLDIFPHPGTGQVTRVDRNGRRTIVATGLDLPTGLTVGPDGALYVTTEGFGPPVPGSVMRIQLRGGDHDEGWDD